MIRLIIIYKVLIVLLVILHSVKRFKSLRFNRRVVIVTDMSVIITAFFFSLPQLILYASLICVIQSNTTIRMPNRR